MQSYAHLPRNCNEIRPDSSVVCWQPHWHQLDLALSVMLKENRGTFWTFCIVFQNVLTGLGKEDRMRMDAFVSAIGCILFSLVAFQVTAAPQDEEENEDFIVHVLPPLKLGLPICAFKADSGPCKAINNRYHFNIQTRQCEMFNYGGCEGNANNFQTLEECQEKCIVPEHIMRKVGLDESPVGIKIAGRNINNLRYADDTTLMAESEEELKSLLMRVKEESTKVGLKLNMKKTKIMASGPLTSWQIDGEEMEEVTDFIFLGSKITTDGDCSQEIKRRLLLGRKAMANLDSILKSRDIILPTKVRIVKAMVFPVAMYGCESWTIRKAECRRIEGFELWCWRRLLRVPWTARRSNRSVLEEINPDCSLEGQRLKMKLKYFGHLMRRKDSLEKSLMLGTIDGKRRRGRQRMRWLDGVTEAVDFPETRKRTKFKTGIERPSYCLLESQPGICRALFSRYFYNKETQMCENFFYSGCLGNRNNFLSLKECQDTCQGSFPSGNSWQTENDSLPFGETNNSAPVAKRVTSANSLQTKEDSVLLSIKNNSSPVVKQESPLLPSLCVMPMDKGLCRASEKRFFYNYNTRKCYPFSYTGCGGNENNFTTRKACMKMCKKGFIKKQGQKGIMKIRRKRKKQPVKETNQRIKPPKTTPGFIEMMPTSPEEQMAQIDEFVFYESLVTKFSIQIHCSLAAFGLGHIKNWEGFRVMETYGNEHVASPHTDVVAQKATEITSG
ncbi:Tissue factor pathway inhibitor [Varanus komodoensis]|nr:Tissue factor pathway inhibitor [Varanus komodoensis]